jgi:ATP-binding cassette subfamily F protein uup
MAIVLTAHDLEKSFGARPLFAGLGFVVADGDRVGLVGPNGAGKSTLLRILAGRLAPDRGTVAARRGARVGFLEQTPVLPPGTVREVVRASAAHDEDGARTGAILSKLELADRAELTVDTLSGGWRKRVALARELVAEPDLLLLDEPTNHLDIESILWLEEFLARAAFATVTVTHDRAFLQRVANRIVEIDRRHPGGMLSVDGDYATFLERKGAALDAQAKQESSLRNRLRRETEWLRRGAKARTTKQQARIHAAEELGKEVGELEYRNTHRVAQIDFAATDHRPKRLLEAKRIAKALGGKTLFRDLRLELGPGDRVGLLGRNGCGKSTLLRVLLGDERPDEGSVFRSEHLRVAYFEQNRESLDPDVPLRRWLCPHGEHVIYRGKPVHVNGYLDRFLFRKEQYEMPVGRLSGGEQSRLLIARLMLREANLLVLDEPTNDLDAETLDVLEGCLLEFDGAILLVTHDRYFLDQVATQILAFPEDGSGTLVGFAGVDQWKAWRDERHSPRKKETAPREATAPSASRKRKLSYHEERELQSMEKNIQDAEAALEKLQAEAQSPAHASNAAKLTELYAAVAEAQAKVDALYARWAELEAMKATLQ